MNFTWSGRVRGCPVLLPSCRRQVNLTFRGDKINHNINYAYIPFFPSQPHFSKAYFWIFCLITVPLTDWLWQAAAFSVTSAGQYHTPLLQLCSSIPSFLGILREQSDNACIHFISPLACALPLPAHFPYLDSQLPPSEVGGKRVQ